MNSRPWLAVALVFGTTIPPILPRTPQSRRPEVGSEAPTLSCRVAPQGPPVALERFEGRTVAIVFWSGSQEFGRRGVTELLETLDATKVDPVPVVILVSPDREAWEQVRSRSKAERAEVVLAEDAERRSNAAYGVVALPTAFVLDGTRKVVHVVRGFGPLFAFSVQQGLRRAGGEIDDAQLEEILSARGSHRTTTGPNDRNVELARRLLANGDTERAKALLEEAARASPPPATALALLARIALEDDSTSEAAQWVQRLEERDPGALDTRLLRVAVTFHEGDLDRATTLLETLDATQPEVAYYRARLLEGRSQWQEAAAVYRAALESVLRGRR